MKTKTKKQPKISPYARLKTAYHTAQNEQFRLQKDVAVFIEQRDENHEDAEKWERAYRNLKNLIGKYMAMMASDYGVDKERARNLEAQMFSEPGDAEVPFRIFHNTNKAQF